MITIEERKRLYKNIDDLLNEYGYIHKREYIYQIIDEWESNKSVLINAFKKHPGYVDGEFYIKVDSKFSRVVDKKGIEDFYRWISIGPLEDTSLLNEEVYKKKEEEHCYYLPSNLYSLVECQLFAGIQTHVDEFLSKNIEVATGLKIAPGTKMSRAVNKIMTYIGYNKHPDYNREFAKYADAVSPMDIPTEVYVSINPMDYFTMSFGNSWASCHTIDKRNKRGMPNTYSGMYSSGTMSYMLDESSIVVYTTTHEPEKAPYWRSKINRQMFHYGAHKLVQGRLYPQSNDGNGSVYDPYRNIMQDLISTIFEFPNYWGLSRGISSASEYIMSEGTHYRDYDNFESCTLSVAKQYSEDKGYFNVGHNPICPNCGTEHDTNENIICEDCDGRHKCFACGERCPEEDMFYINDEWYCNDCCTMCECCESVVSNNDIRYVESTCGYVCDRCVDLYYTRCEWCSELYLMENMTLAGDDEYYCEDCIDNHFTRCEKCGKLYYNSDIMFDDQTDRYLCSDCYEEETKKEENKSEEN